MTMNPVRFNEETMEYLQKLVYTHKMANGMQSRNFTISENGVSTPKPGCNAAIGILNDVLQVVDEDFSLAINDLLRQAQEGRFFEPTLADANVVRVAVEICKGNVWLNSIQKKLQLSNEELDKCVDFLDKLDLLRYPYDEGIVIT